jgi:sorbose reductase
MTASDTPFKSLIKGKNEPNVVPTTPETLSKNIVERFSLRGKVSVITGGAGAIGSAIAEGFAQAGSDVIILDLKPNSSISQGLESEYKVRSKSFQVDITKSEDVKAVIYQIEKEFGTIDVFVANAGIAWYTGSILNENSTPEAWRKVFDVNVHGVFYCAKYAGEIFKKNGKGSFIITASMSAHIVNVPNYQSCYNSAKAAVLHLSKSLAVEFAGFARVNTVSPGYTNTSLSDPIPTEERAKWWGLTPMGREAMPDELVGAYIYLASDASSFTTGSDIRVDGGYCSV